MRTRLLLVRHGETSYTARKVYCGHADPPLSAKGEAQARSIRAKLARFRPEAAYTSDLARAAGTARIALPGMPASPSERLREMDFGPLEGLSHDEALARYPVSYRRWLKSPSGGQAPRGVEGAAAFRRRIVSAMRLIAEANPGRTVAVFCHGGPVSVFLSWIYGADDIWGYLPAPAGVGVVDCLDGKPRVVSFSRAPRGRTIWKK